MSRLSVNQIKELAKSIIAAVPVKFGRANGAELTSPGQRPGYASRQSPALKGRRNSAPSKPTQSIPNVTLIKFDLVTFQERPKFLLKTLIPVMFRLIRNIRFHLVHPRLPDGKRSVAALPMKSRKFLSLGLDPFGSRAFDLHDDLRQRMILVQRE